MELDKIFSVVLKKSPESKTVVIEKGQKVCLCFKQHLNDINVIWFENSH